MYFGKRKICLKKTQSVYVIWYTEKKEKRKRGKSAVEDESKEYDKVRRILELYTKLLNGHSIQKAEEAANYGVSERTLQRDIADISFFLDDLEDGSGIRNSLKYNGKERTYCLERAGSARFTFFEIIFLLGQPFVYVF